MNRHLPARLVLAGIPLFALSLFVACGDDVENTTINQTGVELFDSSEDLPECTDKNESDLVFVRGETSARICVDGEWIALSSDGSDVDFSCKTVELKDKSGLKIVCNGDSIGVVLNGSDGKAGEDGDDGISGTGCTITDRNETAVVVTCGDSTMTIDLGYRLPTDTAEADSERTPISLDSLVGYTQKGPFLKGSTVYLYELSDGRTLKQTNGNFTSNITRDDGRYKFTARDLVSQYAMVVVDGYYRNEVTGGSSDAPIRLKAITDMRKRSSVNVNLLTHMEFDRVYSLVTRGDKDGKKLTVKQAKRQAQKEILKLFDIELEKDTDAEDMDVFGKTDADAALLAVSVLLQGDGGSTDLSVLLTEISNAIAENGEWNDSAAKARIADWALKADSDNRLAKFRENVGKWRLNGDTTVPEFEKFVRSFVGEMTGIGVCGSEIAPLDTIVHVSNSNSTYFAKSYTDTSESETRFICDAKGGAHWRIASDLEKDTLGWGRTAEVGVIKKGNVNTNLTYVYEGISWRHGTELDGIVGIGCVDKRKDTVSLGSDSIWYKCKGDTSIQYNARELIESEWRSAWRKAKNIEMDTAGWGISANEGDVSNGRINADLVYVFENGSWRHGTQLDSIVGYACLDDMKDSIVRNDDDWFLCADTTMDVFEANELSHSSAWHKMDNIEKDFVIWNTYKDSADGTLSVGPFTGNTMVWDADTLRQANETEKLLKRGCVTRMYGQKYLLPNSLTYICNNTGWSKTGTFFDDRGDYYDRVTYKGVQIGNQTWMAENLKYATANSYCYDNSSSNCEKYGRLYVWEAALNACPNGWHLPTKEEWETLFNYVAGGLYKAALPLKSQTGWNENANGSDVYSFSGIPAGGRYDNKSCKEEGSSVVYEYIGYGASFWSATEYYLHDSVYYVALGDDGNGYINNWCQYHAFSVRCVKD